MGVVTGDSWNFSAMGVVLAIKAEGGWRRYLDQIRLEAVEDRVQLKGVRQAHPVIAVKWEWDGGHLDNPAPPGFWFEGRHGANKKKIVSILVESFRKPGIGSCHTVGKGGEAFGEIGDAQKKLRLGNGDILWTNNWRDFTKVREK
jgi:hypothetical protein